VGAGSSSREAAENFSRLFVIAIDISREKLSRIRDSKLHNLDLVNCSAHALPLRSGSMDCVMMVLTMHELPRDLVDAVLEEVARVLKPGRRLLVADKAFRKPQRPSELLPYLVEVAYHSTKRFLGLEPLVLMPRTPKKYVEIVSRHLEIESVEQRELPWVEPQRFLSSWGRETKSLVERLPEPQRTWIKTLIDRIESTAREHGYGPTPAIVILARKRLDQ